LDGNAVTTPAAAPGGGPADRTIHLIGTGPGGTQFLWGDQALWGDQFLWGEQFLWGDQVRWGDQVLWGDTVAVNSMWASQSIWSAGGVPTGESSGIASRGEN
jgi:hypothetical protein